MRNDPRNRVRQRVTEYQRELVAILVDARKQQGLVQQDITDRTGIPRASVSKFEGCQVVPRLDTILDYADAIGLDVEVRVRHRA